MPYDETDGTYYYKKIKLTVIPRQAEIVWNELSFMYDGTDHTPSGYILDIAQNKRYIDVEIHDSADNLLPQTTVR